VFTQAINTEVFIKADLTIETWVTWTWT